MTTEYKQGDVVTHDSQLYRIGEFTPCVGGGTVAQLECIDRIHHMAKSVETLGPVVPMTADDVSARIADRDERMRPVIKAAQLRVTEKVIRRSRQEIAELLALGDDADDQDRARIRKLETRLASAITEQSELLASS